LSVVIIGAALIEQWKGLLLSRVKIDDPFAKASLMADVHWTGFEIIPGIILLAGVLLYLFYSARNNRKALLLLFATSMIAINGTIIMITPKVEPYSQGAMIEFFQDKSRERNIVETVRFKSYANLFYAARNPDFSKPVADSFIHFGLHPEIPVYYVGKIQNAEENEKENTNLQRLYSKNGFVFYKLKR
jgi:hypothetical protein